MKKRKRRGVIAVGGIYTVLRTKAQASTDELGEQYCMLGPYSEERAKMELETLQPDNNIMRNALEWTRECGFKVTRHQEARGTVAIIWVMSLDRLKV